jgi:glycine/sarcosine N-methyltransferase
MAAETGSFYDDLAADYDRMIRWDRRLKQERPQFEALWRRYGVRTVLDAACGTGHHIAMFADMGLEVAGTDAAFQMVEAARRTTRAAGMVRDDRIRCCRWSELSAVMPGAFDAVLCIGNSLPYVLDPGELRQSVKGLWSRVAPGGILLIQFKNFEKLCATRQRFLPLSWSEPPHETVALRLYDYAPGRVDFNVILLDRTADGWVMRHRVTPLKPYLRSDIEPLLTGPGAEVGVYGGLNLDPFDPVNSEDLLLLARRTQN